MTMPPAEDRIAEPAAAPVRGVWPEVAIIAVSCFLLFWGLGERGLWRSEGRWAEISRQMMLTGDYFHPMVGGEPYFDKPAGTYWPIVAAAALIGGMNELATRLPSAVCGLIVIVATMWLGRRLWSAAVGRIGAALVATCFGFLFWSRTAAADMENTAAIMLAVAWYWHKRDRPGFWAFLVFYLIVFLGALTKGLPAVVMSVLVILPDIVMGKRWKQVLTPSHLLAGLLGLAIYLAPFVYASQTKVDTYKSSGLALVVRENIQRFVLPFDHTGPVYLYLYGLPEYLLPWAPLYVTALVGAIIIRKKLDPHTRWLIWAGVVLLAFLTASGSRRVYYALPLLPLSTLLIGIIWTHAQDSRLVAVRRIGVIVQAVMLVILIGLELAGPAIGRMVGSRYGFTVSRELSIALVTIGAASGVLAVAALIWARRLSFNNPKPFWALIGVGALVMGGFFCWQQIILDGYRTGRSFALGLKEEIAGMPLDDVAFYRSNSGIVLFYLNTEKPVQVLHTATDLREFLLADRKRVVITKQRYVEDARRAMPAELSRSPDFAERTEPWMSRPSDEDLAAWLIPGGAAAPDAQVSEADHAS